MAETTLFVGVLGALVAFVDDHKRCGDLDGGLAHESLHGLMW